MSLIPLGDRERRLLFQKPSPPLYSCDPASICSTYILGPTTLVGPLDNESSQASVAAIGALAHSFAMPQVSRLYDDRLDVYYLCHPTMTYLDTSNHPAYATEEWLLEAVRALPYRPLLPLSHLVRIGVFNGHPSITLRPCPWQSR